jgi:hypothetical protein
MLLLGEIHILSVIPAKAGIQLSFQIITLNKRDPSLRWGDESCEIGVNQFGTYT